MVEDKKKYRMYVSSDFYKLVSRFGEITGENHIKNTKLIAKLVTVNDIEVMPKRTRKKKTIKCKNTKVVYREC